MTRIEEIKNRLHPYIDEQINSYFLKKGLNHLSSQMSSYHFSTGGKRLRALVPSMVFDAYGSNAQTILPFGIAVEIIHNATLVHDDLQDGDEYRRNELTVWKKFGPEQAINCGDALFQMAYEFIFQLEIADDRKLKLMRRMVSNTLSVIEGQSQEFLMKDEVYPKIDRYFEVAKGKTSSLFSLPLVGALEGLGISETDCKEVESYTDELGVLFQIQDDLLDLYGKKGRQEVATDIAEGKISLLVARFNETASLDDCKTVRTVLKKKRSDTTEQDIQVVLNLFDRYECKQFAIKTIYSIQEKLLDKNSLRKFPEVKLILEQLTKTFLEPIHAIL